MPTETATNTSVCNLAKKCKVAVCPHGIPHPDGIFCHVVGCNMTKNSQCKPIHKEETR